MSDSKDKSIDATDSVKVPRAVVNRLSLYLRELQRMVRDGNETTSSGKLGDLLGFTSAQVRKDLAYFGQFGYPGIGYRCEELVLAIRKIMGTNQPWPVAMVGTGNLGRALLGYKGFGQQGFQIVAAFDVDDSKVGTKIDDVAIYHLNQINEVVKKNHIKIGMIVVPALAAQPVAEKLVEAGVEGIVNFAPVTITLPDHVNLIGVDLAIELEQLAFSIVAKSGKK